MAIQNRRGTSKDFDASKMLPGEFAVTTDGSRKAYVAFQANDVKELAFKEDIKVTEENIKEALGYTPADQEDITELNEKLVQETGKLSEDITELNEKLVEETSKISSEIVELEKFHFKKLNYTKGKYLSIASIGNKNYPHLPNEADGIKFAIEECSQGSFVVLNCVGGNGPRAYAFLDSNYITIECAESNATINNVTLIAPLNTAYLVVNDFSDSESYIKIYDYVTPELYGAIGDGVTDDTGSLKQCLLQDKPVYLSGNYRITEDLYITRRNFKIFGKTGAYSVTAPTLYFENASLRINEENASNLRMNSFAIRSNTICLLIDGCERVGNFLFDDIQFIGNKCVKIDAESGYIWFVNCKFTTFADGTSTTDDCLVDLRYTGDTENRLNYVYFDRCAIEGGGIPNNLDSGVLIRIGNCSNINITNCDICNAAFAIVVDGTYGSTQWVKMTNNYIWRITTVLNMSGINHSLFANNSVYNRSGQPLVVGNVPRNNAIVGNVFMYWTQPTAGEAAGNLFKSNIISEKSASLERIAPREDLINVEKTHLITLGAGKSVTKTFNMRICYVDTLYITCSDKDITHTSAIDGTNFNVTLTNNTSEDKEFLMFVH